jgi:uncharacterized protein (TIGR03067 family)
MRNAIFLILAAGLVVTGLAHAGDAQKDLEAMQGKWSITSIEESTGKPPPEDSIKEFLVTVKDDVMKVTHGSAAAVVLKIKVDASKNPKTIDFTHMEGPDKGKTELGIYKLEGDTWTYCVADIGKDRPTAFATGKGTRNAVLVLKKMK